MIALSPKKYLSKKWNIFDTLIAIFSIFDLLFSDSKGFSVLKSFRLVTSFFIFIGFNKKIILQLKKDESF
jgi:hypothetical protein